MMRADNNKSSLTLAGRHGAAGLAASAMMNVQVTRRPGRAGRALHPHATASPARWAGRGGDRYREPRDRPPAALAPSFLVHYRRFRASLVPPPPFSLPPQGHHCPSDDASAARPARQPLSSHPQAGRGLTRPLGGGEGATHSSALVQGGSGTPFSPCVGNKQHSTSATVLRVADTQESTG